MEDEELCTRTLREMGNVRATHARLRTHTRARSHARTLTRMRARALANANVVRALACARTGTRMLRVVRADVRADHSCRVELLAVAAGAGMHGRIILLIKSHSGQL